MCNFVFCREEMEAPPNVNPVRVTCIGRIDPVVVLDTLANGADGVMLVGCQPPDCHYLEGNVQAEHAVKMLKKLVAFAGLEPDRIKLQWVSPVEEKSFYSYAQEFSEEVGKLGASPLRGEKLQSELVTNIMAAKDATSDFRLRVLLGREKELTEGVNVYGEKVPAEDFDFLLDEIVREEFIRHKIYLLTKAKPLSVKTLGEAVGMKPSAVLRQIVDMRRRNMVALDHVDGTTPFYKALEVK
jgi:F420-non-reducing hydrogenase iron-sulfur subunit